MQAPYFEALTAESMADVVHGGVEIARKHYKLTQDMLEAGTTSERDVKVADADVSEAELGLTKAENGVALAHACGEQATG